MLFYFNLVFHILEHYYGIFFRQQLLSLVFLLVRFMSDNENARQWIFAATIGMFLYIALVDLVSLLLEYLNKYFIISIVFFQLPTLLTDGKIELKRFFVVNIGFLFGIIVMFLIAIYEDNILNFRFK